jgi:hypothetical protein
MQESEKYWAENGHWTLVNIDCHMFWSGKMNLKRTVPTVRIMHRSRVSELVGDVGDALIWVRSRAKVDSKTKYDVSQLIKHIVVGAVDQAFWQNKGWGTGEMISDRKYQSGEQDVYSLECAWKVGSLNEISVTSGFAFDIRSVLHLSHCGGGRCRTASREVLSSINFRPGGRHWEGSAHISSATCCLKFLTLHVTRGWTLMH